MNEEEAIAAVMDAIENQDWLEDASTAKYDASFQDDGSYLVEVNHPDFEESVTFKARMVNYDDGSAEGPFIELIKDWEED